MNSVTNSSFEDEEKGMYDALKLVLIIGFDFVSKLAGCSCSQSIYEGSAPIR